MIVRIVISIMVYSLAGWLFCDIEPDKSYSWYSGIWHGIFFLCNYVRSFFFDADALYKAEIYTTAYNVFYWIFSITSTISMIFPAGNVGRRY